MIDAEAALLSGEIHDELMPLMFASSATVHRLIRDLDGETGEDNLNRLREVAKWLGEGMETGRQLIGGVFPPDFQTQSWYQRAEARLNQLDKRATDVVSWSIAPNANQVSSEVAFAAMRITVEACRNAMGHGRANQVDVRAEVTDDKLILSVVDNGTGFDPDQVPEGHFGLRVMKQRAAHAGGELFIDSKQDAGTMIKVVMP